MQEADRLAFLSGLLLCAEGLYRLAESSRDDMLLVLRKVLHSFRRAVIGALMEHTGPEQWTPEFYERLIVLKNVDFWRCVYSAVDPARRSPLYPFLERYYAVAQKLNDVVDFPEDVKRGQPNLLSLHLQSGNGSPPPVVGGRLPHLPEEVERDLALALLDLAPAHRHDAGAREGRGALEARRERTRRAGDRPVHECRPGGGTFDGAPRSAAPRLVLLARGRGRLLGRGRAGRARRAGSAGRQSAAG